MTHDPSTDTRNAGEVVRYHAWKTLQHQTVGEHSWQVLRIYDELFGLADANVARFMLYHDAPELVTGDVPFGAKRRSPALKAASDEAADAAAREMGIAWPEVTERQRAQVKLCDLLDMYEFGVREVQMGNTLGRPIVRATAEAILALIKKSDSPLDSAGMCRFEGYRWRHDLPPLAEGRAW